VSRWGYGEEETGSGGERCVGREAKSSSITSCCNAVPIKMEQPWNKC
jgi:hypothetical protein